MSRAYLLPRMPRLHQALLQVWLMVLHWRHSLDHDFSRSVRAAGKGCSARHSTATVPPSAHRAAPCRSNQRCGSAFPGRLLSGRPAACNLPDLPGPVSAR
uniref:Putative secreted protein n=1 Tax=Anopheles darlingi TaxID=43151 RepID=A0A2M4DJ39_ANODA